MTAGTRTVVVGVVANPRGTAALQHAVEEAHRRDARLIVVNSSRGDALVDEDVLFGDRLRQLHDELTVSGLPFKVRQPVLKRQDFGGAHPAEIRRVEVKQHVLFAPVTVQRKFFFDFTVNHGRGFTGRGTLAHEY